MEKLKDIIRNNNMSSRPEYYSGRGATLSDLNEKILFGIHKDIIKTFDKEAGEGFVQMVNNIKVLSATAFLNGLYDLYYNNWKATERQPESITVPKTKNGDYDIEMGIFGMMEAMFNSNNKRDDTMQIKSNFLHSNDIKQDINIYVDVFGNTHKRY